MFKWPPEWFYLPDWWYHSPEVFLEHCRTFPTLALVPAKSTTGLGLRIFSEYLNSKRMPRIWWLISPVLLKDSLLIACRTSPGPPDFLEILCLGLSRSTTCSPHCLEVAVSWLLIALYRSVSYDLRPFKVKLYSNKLTDQHASFIPNDFQACSGLSTDLRFLSLTRRIWLSLYFHEDGNWRKFSPKPRTRLRHHWFQRSLKSRVSFWNLSLVRPIAKSGSESSTFLPTD